MPAATWRPASEADAVGARAVFLEWLCAVHGIALDGPTGLDAWRRAAPDAFAAAVAAFCGLARDDDRPLCGTKPCVRDVLLRRHGARPALIVATPAGRPCTWSRADLLVADPLPPPIANMLAALTPADLPALAASHLLDAGTAPDDLLVWAGDRTDPWPLGAWLIGAAVRVTASGGQAGAAAIRTAPRWRV